MVNSHTSKKKVKTKTKTVTVTESSVVPTAPTTDPTLDPTAQPSQTPLFIGADRTLLVLHSASQTSHLFASLYRRLEGAQDRDECRDATVRAQLSFLGARRPISFILLSHHSNLPHRAALLFVAHQDVAGTILFGYRVRWLTAPETQLLHVIT